MTTTIIIVAIITAGFFYIAGFYLGYNQVSKDNQELKRMIHFINKNAESTKERIQEMNKLKKTIKETGKQLRKGIKKKK
tara:strand:- start:74 stop:310 length:237 start_codon:yes stop_codon:yes gene_type:complete